MHIEFLVEELSAEKALRCLLPALLPDEVTFEIHAHRGKPDLLSKLSGRLAGYASWIPEDWRICILVDQDKDNCLELKRCLVDTAKQAGIRALVRIAVEELESWFFGDPLAVHQAYPRVSPTFADKAKYRNPDAIRGGTSEALERELQRAQYYKGGLPKSQVAHDIARFMDPARNRSKSFQVFRDGLQALLTSWGS
ncbi:MAG: DUF4276 family protein [Bacillota bacterium]